MKELIEKLENSKTDKDGMSLDGFEMSKNDGIETAIQICIEHFKNQ